VVRRSRNGRSLDYEAKVMAYVRAQGYPVPEVFDVTDDGRELVMERIVGATMVEVAAKKPWLLRRFGTELGELHARLHRLDGPEWLREAPVGHGDKVVHMDLHPLNVLVTKRGPVVIDWTNTSRGDPAVDAAATWILLASGEVPASGLRALIVRVGRSTLLKGFLGTMAMDDLDRVVSDVVEWKCRDANMSDVERDRMRALAQARAH
jgi:aminoglycoside phosphotransferase (APT) family kinase protein